ncbi:high affinity immunoglobulin gamma Fc receptor I-like isoform X2 [Engystomops pustulosus]|uniref:high affinity immunoglobulin gamma Fc receptor I-like isoform X2 n=1 Tax=Engystomops pustulosus TaxID=76066 RepID=UPI003AFB52C3
MLLVLLWFLHGHTGLYGQSYPGLPDSKPYYPPRPTLTGLPDSKPYYPPRPKLPGLPDSKPYYPPRPKLTDSDWEIIRQDAGDVTSPVILGEYDLVEGDSLLLTCDTSLHQERQNTELRYAFFRNGLELPTLSSSNKYHVPMVHQQNSGNYTCEVRTADDSVRKMSGNFLVTIAELFSFPLLQVSRDPVVEGQDITLTCNTSLSLKNKNVELQFIFYKGTENIQESSSNKYEISSANLQDSGTYHCLVGARGVNKWSPATPVHVKGRKKDYTTQNIVRLILSVGLLIGLFAIIVFHVRSEA